MGLKKKIRWLQEAVSDLGSTTLRLDRRIGLVEENANRDLLDQAKGLELVRRKLEDVKSELIEEDVEAVHREMTNRIALAHKLHHDSSRRIDALRSELDALTKKVEWIQTAGGEADQRVTETIAKLDDLTQRRFENQSARMSGVESGIRTLSQQGNTDRETLNGLQESRGRLEGRMAESERGVDRRLQKLERLVTLLGATEIEEGVTEFSEPIGAGKLIVDSAIPDGQGVMGPKIQTGTARLGGLFEKPSHDDTTHRRQGVQDGLALAEKRAREFMTKNHFSKATTDHVIRAIQGEA